MKKGTQALSILLGFFAATFFLSGAMCAGEEGKTKMAIMTIGSRTDASWSQSYYEAYQYLNKKYPKVTFSFADMNPYPEFPSILEATAQLGVNIVYCENAWIEAVTKVAPKFPKTWFIMPGAMTSQIEMISSDNVVDYHQKWEQGAFLAGVATGLMTKTGKVAYIAGHDYPNVVRVGVGLKEGMSLVNAKAELMVMYTGDWNDVQKGYEAAKAMIEQGADVLIHHNDNAGKGIFKAARDFQGRKIYLIGYVRDQHELAPGNMITSYRFDHSKVAEQVLLDYQKGALKKGVRSFGIKDGWEAIAPIRNTSAEIKSKVEEIEGQIRSGKLEVPIVVDSKALTGTRSR